MMAIRSEGVICVLRNFWAAVCARIWSGIGMLVLSKNITSRRRSLYFTSPALRGCDRLGRRLRAVWPSGVDADVASGTGDGRFFQFLEFEDFDRLLLAVFGDVEVGGLEPFEGSASCPSP